MASSAKRVHPLELGALAFAPLAISCSSADLTPPVIEDAHFEDLSTLILTFSEPLAPTDEIVPETHFRLSVGFSLSNLELTAYYDLSTHFSGEVPGQSGALAEIWPRHGDTQIVRIEAGDDPAQLRLLLSAPVDPYVCEALLAADAIDVPAGIHLHYARDSAPRITDLSGNELAELAPWWLDAAPATSSTRDEGFLALDPRMPIPCPSS